MAPVDLWTNRQVIIIHAGQCGVQTASALWDSMRKEYAIERDGSVEVQNIRNNDTWSPESLYKESSKKATYFPRSLLFDLDPLTIDNINAGVMKKTFSQEYMVSGTEDAAGCFARGRYVQGLQIIGKLREKVRNQLEACDACAAMIHIGASSGGTGSGVIPDVLTVEDTKRSYSSIGIVVYASQNLDQTIGYYNTVLHMNAMNDLIDMNIMTDNEALYRVGASSLNNVKTGRTKTLTYEDLNQQLGMIASAVTVGDRFVESENLGIRRMKTCLVPYLGLSYINVTMTPFQEPSNRAAPLTQLAKYAFGTWTSATIDRTKGQYLGSYLCLRGINRFSHETTEAIKKSTEAHNFASWIPCRVSLGYCPMSFPTNVGIYELGPNTITNFYNHSSVADTFERYSKWFGLNYTKRSFVHWYLEHGMEEIEFSEALEAIDLVRRVYKSVSGLDDDRFEDGQQ